MREEKEEREEGEVDREGVGEEGKLCFQAVVDTTVCQLVVNPVWI